MTKQRNRGLRKRCECPRKNWAKCSHPWHFNFKWKGEHYRFSLDREVGHPVTSKTEAEKEADRLRTAIREGVFRQQRREAPHRQRQHPPRLRLRSDNLRRTGRPSEARNSSGQRTTTIDSRR